MFSALVKVHKKREMRTDHLCPIHKCRRRKYGPQLVIHQACSQLPQFSVFEAIEGMVWVCIVKGFVKHELEMSLVLAIYDAEIIELDTMLYEIGSSLSHCV